MVVVVVVGLLYGEDVVLDVYLVVVMVYIVGFDFVIFGVIVIVVVVFGQGWDFDLVFDVVYGFFQVQFYYVVDVGIVMGLVWIIVVFVKDVVEDIVEDIVYVWIIWIVVVYVVFECGVVVVVVYVVFVVVGQYFVGFFVFFEGGFGCCIIWVVVWVEFYCVVMVGFFQFVVGGGVGNVQYFVVIVFVYIVNWVLESWDLLKWKSGIRFVFVLGVLICWWVVRILM